MTLNVIQMRVLGRSVSISYVDIDDEHFGWLSADGSEIKIRKGMSAADTLDTIIHEVLHLIYTLLNVDVETQDEERVVSLTATVFSAILIENVEFGNVIQNLSESARKLPVPE